MTMTDTGRMPSYFGRVSEKGCPRCGGARGHRHVMTESHLMQGAWGEQAEAGDSGIDVKRSLVACIDCGAKFQHEALVKRGLV